ncbi:MAG TPA: patatin-like phospholipase family protein [Aggregatilineales bacterium]|nr:patatin-like phospholipase family protein [Anaerolineales bacterium]HRE46725.1 patatin-like phospholipase family protein [Aggregatilineales bacterium]
MRDIPQLRPKTGTALVLSGGANKAFYFHLGVLKALRNEPVTSIVGSSAGAVIGAFLATGAPVDAMIATLYQKDVYFAKFDTWVHTLTSNMLFRAKLPEIARQGLTTYLAGLRFLLGLPRLIGKDIVAEFMDTVINSQEHLDGFFDNAALETLIRDALRSTDFADTEIDLYVTGTGLDDGRRAVFNGIYNFTDDQNDFMTDVPIHKAVRASTAIPGLFEPMKIKGRNYIDGEIKQTLSADIGVRLADRVIISYTYQPLHLEGETSIRDMGWLNVVRQATNIAFHERISIWRTLYEQQNPHKQLIWIHPDPDDIAIFKAPDFAFSPDIQRKLIDAGEIAALKALGQVTGETSYREHGRNGTNGNGKGSLPLPDAKARRN